MADDSWRQLDNALHERIAWARVKLTEFTRPVDAARALHIKPVTYRTYEQPKWDGGRAPPVVMVQQIAKKYGVSWTWLLSGQGSPYDEPETDLKVMATQITERLRDVPEEKRQDAIAAMQGVLESYIKRAS